MMFHAQDTSFKWNYYYSKWWRWMGNVSCASAMQPQFQNKWIHRYTMSPSTTTQNQIQMHVRYEWILCECMSRVEMKIISRLLFTWKAIHKLIYIYEFEFEYIYINETRYPESNNNKQQQPLQPNKVCRFVCIYMTKRINIAQACNTHVVRII